MAAFSVLLPAEMICHPDYMDSKMFSCEKTTLAGVLPPSTVGGESWLMRMQYFVELSWDGYKRSLDFLTQSLPDFKRSHIM